MSKLSFRARQLDAWKPMPIYMSEELPDLPEYSAINRAVPQMPSGILKEEECEHHLQRAIITGLIIPTPETQIGDVEAYNKLYPSNYKLPRQLIHMQPFDMEQDIPDYDMDSEDEAWVNSQAKTLDITPLKFEEMMDRLEKNSGHSAVTQSEAKLLLKEDDDLIIAVYDYWLNKRLKTQHSLIPSVKTEAHRLGNAYNNPYLAFRRNTKKMQTRKNRKNGETSYEKMIKLRRDLRRALTLLELVKRRENTKRELLHLTIEIFEKRYHAGDFSGQILSEVTAMKNSRPAFAPIFSNQFGVNQASNWANKPSKEELVPRKEKRQYKKRKHKMVGAPDLTSVASSGDDDSPHPGVLTSPTSPPVEETSFTFRRSKSSSYQPPVKNGTKPWYPRDDAKMLNRCKFHPVIIKSPSTKHVISGRARIGRGGRLLLDRGMSPGSHDDFWEACGFTIHDSVIPKAPCQSNYEGMKTYRPKTPPRSSVELEDMSEPPYHLSLGTDTQIVLQVEDLMYPDDTSPLLMNLNDFFPSSGLTDNSAVDSELTLLEMPPNNSSGSEVLSSQKDALSDCGASSLMDIKTPIVKTENLSSDLPQDHLSVDFKDLISNSGILFDRLSGSNDGSSSPVGKGGERSTAPCPVPPRINVDAVRRTLAMRGLMGREAERRENAGSLLDRWARFESSSEPNRVVKKSKPMLDVFAGDDSVGHSAFKTINSSPPMVKKNHCRTSPKKKCEVGGLNLKDLVILDRYSTVPKTPPVNSVQQANSLDLGNRLMTLQNTSWMYRRKSHTTSNYLSTKFVSVKPSINPLLIEPASNSIS